MHVLDIWGLCREHSLVTMYEVQDHFFLFPLFSKFTIFTSLPYFIDHIIFLPDQVLDLVKNAHVPRLGHTLISIFIDVQGACRIPVKSVHTYSLE